jgi:sterol desaturase/sphingolipid hydroxylase (fatty acid hydroxylase superfamily)
MEEWMLRHAASAQFVVFFSLLLTLAAVEVWKPGRRTDPRRRRRWPANFALTAINVVVLSAVPVTFVSAATWAEHAEIGLFQQLELPLAVLFTVNLLARSFVSFGTHLVMHRVPLLWRLHRVHHLDVELDVTTTVRFHPLELVSQLALGLPLIVLLGLEPWVLLAYEILDAAVTLFSHSNVALPGRIERWLRYLIVTPGLHRVHHSAVRDEGNSNFGAVFPHWDLLFGTFRANTRAPAEALQLGLAEERGASTWSLRTLLASPFRGAPPLS